MPVFFRDTRYVPGPKALGSPSPGHRPRCTTQVKDPSGLVPLVSKVRWLRQASAKTTDPHVLVTWVKKIGGHAQAGEPHSPSGRAGRGLDEHSVSVVAFQPRSPAGQAGRGLTRLVLCPTLLVFRRVVEKGAYTAPRFFELLCGDLNKISLVGKRENA